jgi:TolB-like protein/cytochrome c-type biogenesis protein CcmH/NrfG
MSLFSELKRRNVFRVGAAYIVVAWLIIQVAETLFPLFGFGDGPARIVVIVLAIGFVPVLILSWAFELTPDGLKRDSDVDPEFSIAPHTGKKLDRTIMVVLVLALAYFAFDKFVLDPQRDVEITESATRAGAEQAREEARLGMFSDRSVAVLPFTNRSEQKEDEYFTDGMHDELLTRLSRIAAMKVISRTSVMHYRDTNKTIPEIARELSVATILEGGVQRSGNQVRINVQLIDAHTDEHLWAEIYDRELTADNLFAIQSEISTAIADALRATLSPEEKSRVYDLPTSNMDAYNHYLRGRQSMAARGIDDLKNALAEFEQAVEIDPEFALAWVGVADSSHLLFERDVLERTEHTNVHKQAVDMALALNDQLGEAYSSLALYYQDLREFDKARAAMQKSIELNPNYAQAYLWYANSQAPGPDFDENRLRLLYKAAQLDPLSSIVQINLATALKSLARNEESRQTLQQLSQMDPDFAITYDFLGNLDAEAGQLASAVRSYRKAMRLDPGNGRFMGNAGYVFIALADFEAAAEIRNEIDKYLGPGNKPGGELYFRELLSQSKWPEAIALLDNVPAERYSAGFISYWYMELHMFAGNFEKALEYLLKDNPWVTDREQWQEEYTDKQRFHCDAAGILFEASNKALGQDLARLFIRNFETPPAGNKPNPHRLRSLLACYLVDGSFDTALGILDRETAEGRMLDDWHLWGKMPWWKLLEDDPRYIAIVARIETKLAEQRALLSETDKSGNLVP